ncbi:hypothetical protein FAS41_30510 [Pseudomonas nicosulfuronedens]|uniref:Lipoprotein n=1 Tax=Pseudomonas nicosulfuronedens TaxID=2571105 RepID=A0A5R9QKB4_9PSED|nr:MULTISPECIES: hypothetical protein [Pseudomonas]MBD9634570.1 hypothetical protein [Pseudomonas sp. PDM19]TLX69631.1 hypothetical protein FAS41_30510 [Pseudomonas nicosulfuronedens]
MPNWKFTGRFGLYAGLLLSASCTHQPPADKAEQLPLGVPYVVESYGPDFRDHYTSWGHAGRGGAALREPTYQPVLGSKDVLDTRNGKLYPELQPQPKASHQPMVAVPPGLVAANCAENNGVAQTFALGTPAGGKFITTLANGKGTVNEYVQVRNKLCRGTERLTYDEWLILVNGTPKDLPVHLQAPSRPSTPQWK